MSVVQGAPAARSPVDVPTTAGRRLAWLTITALVALVLGIGVTLVVAVPGVRAAQQAYADATPYRCGHAPAPPAGIECWQGEDAVLLALRQEHAWTGAPRTVAVVRTGGTVQDIDVENAAAAACTSASEAVVIRRSGNTVTAVITAHGVLPTAADPYVDRDLVLDGGITLLAAAALIPAGLYLAVLRRRQTGGEPATRLWSSAPVRLAVLVFLVGQASDVATSAIGQERGLTEGNPLVDVFIRLTGPTGFLLFRLPAIALVLLGLTQVPRRAAVATLIGLGCVFMAVGAHNAVLAAGAPAAVVCGSAVPLP